MFTPLASVDVEDAHRWYEAQRPGLGEDFLAALAVVCQLVSKFPESGPTVRGDVRRILLPRFPYAVYYRVVGDGIEVRACLHQLRNPSAARRRT